MLLDKFGKPKGPLPGAPGGGISFTKDGKPMMKGKDGKAYVKGKDGLTYMRGKDDKTYVKGAEMEQMWAQQFFGTGKRIEKGSDQFLNKLSELLRRGCCTRPYYTNGRHSYNLHKSVL